MLYFVKLALDMFYLLSAVYMTLNPGRIFTFLRDFFFRDISLAVVTPHSFWFAFNVVPLYFKIISRIFWEEVGKILIEIMISL